MALPPVGRRAVPRDLGEGRRRLRRGPEQPWAVEVILKVPASMQTCFLKNTRNRMYL